MENITLTIKDDSKIRFFMDLINQFDFIELRKPVKKDKIDDYDFFASSGLWKDRNTDGNQLRDQAWKKTN